LNTLGDTTNTSKPNKDAQISQTQPETETASAYAYHLTCTTTTIHMRWPNTTTALPVTTQSSTEYKKAQRSLFILYKLSDLAKGARYNLDDE